MKNLILVSLTLFVAVTLYGQGETNVWVTGHNTNKTIINFQQDTVFLIQPNSFLSHHLTNASICDTNGNLLFYTNGIWIANQNHDTLWNGAGLSPGDRTVQFAQNGVGLDLQQGCVILKFSETDFLLIHQSADWLSSPLFPVLCRPVRLFFSQIDMTLDGGLGGVVPGRKNMVFYSDDTTGMSLVAIKHANGKDWWVYTTHYFSNRYIRFLFSLDKIEGPFYQNTGFSIHHLWKKSFSFSPDGKYFATAYQKVENTFGPNHSKGKGNRGDLFRIDRCNGEFTFIDTLVLPDEPYGQVPVSGAASHSCFSPNSKLLYMLSPNGVSQFHLDSVPIQSSRKIVAINDFSNSPGPTLFTQMVLAPNGTIILGSNPANDHYHVIQNPDVPGVGCSVKINNIALLQHSSGGSLPNFPNYQLGPLPIFLIDTPQLQHQINPGDSVTIGIADTVSVIEYEWLAPGTPGWSSNQMLLTVSPDTTTLFLYIRTDTSDTYSCNQRIDSIWVILPPCFALAACPVPPICAGDTAWLCASGDGSYLWSPPYNLHNAASGGTLAWPETTTVYTVTLTLGNGCTATDSVTVIVHQNSAPTFEDTTIRKGHPFGEFFPTADTTIRYHYLNQYGCDSTVYWEVRIDTFNSVVNGQWLMVNVEVFPNPVRGVLYVKHTNQNAAFRLYNKLGQVVLEQQNLPPGTAAVSLSGLAEGVYFWEYVLVETGERVFGKVVKISDEF